MLTALNFVQSEGGIDGEASYPYLAKADSCKFKPDQVAFTDEGGAIAQAGEENLKNLVANYGPVAAAIEAKDKFHRYSSGVFNDESCTGSVTHGILVVGYGTDKKEGDYWIVKNCWGENWGENGYIRVARDKYDPCSIAVYLVIATF